MFYVAALILLCCCAETIWLFILLCTFRFRHYIICTNLSHATGLASFLFDFDFFNNVCAFCLLLNWSFTRTISSEVTIYFFLSNKQNLFLKIDFFFNFTFSDWHFPITSFFSTLIEINSQRIWGGFAMLCDSTEILRRLYPECTAN